MTRRRSSAILGASGYIGQHFARLLADHPEFEVDLLGAGDRSAGRRLADVWHLAEDLPGPLAATRLQNLSPAGLARQGVQVVFSALPSGTAGPFETECTRRGIGVFSNASDHRMDATTPLLVPEVNAPHLRLLDRRPRGRGALVTNPNCSATGLAIGLAPVAPLLGIQTAHVATYQALSGAGHPGVPSLGILDNVVPFIRGEEEKMAAESARILGRFAGGRIAPSHVRVLAQCARVPVRDGHLEAVTITARRRPRLSALLSAWRSFDPLAGVGLRSAPHPPLEVRTEPDRPQPLRDRWAGSSPATRGMTVVIGRVRWEPPNLRFFLLSHNAVRGGAGGSVLNAELAVQRGYLGPR